MDLNFLIALLGLLVAALAETRTIVRDRKTDQIKPLGISLLQLALTLEKIIYTGENLVNLLANLPSRIDANERTNAVQYKREILKLMEIQLEHLKSFDEIYNSFVAISDIDSTTSVTVGNAIELIIGDEVRRMGSKKRRYFQILTWKLLDGEAPLSQVRFAIWKAMQQYPDLVQIDSGRAKLALQCPTEVSIKEIERGLRQEYSTFEISPKDESIVRYDLTKQRDLRRLLENSNAQLSEIKNLHKQITEFLTASFSLSDLVQL